MQNSQSAGVHPSSPKSWRPVREARFDFARRHTFTRDQFVRLFFRGGTMETRKKRTSRFLAKHRERIPVRGAMQRKDTGRPELIYGRKCKPSEAAHEVMVAEFEVLTGIRLERSKKSGRAEPDGTGEKDGVSFSLEVDHSGHMTKKQMQAKWERYKGSDGFVLVVAMTEGRMRKLMEWAEDVTERALFSTFDRLRDAKEPWTDREGKALRI